MEDYVFFLNRLLKRARAYHFCFMLLVLENAILQFQLVLISLHTLKKKKEKKVPKLYTYNK